MSINNIISIDIPQSVADRVIANLNDSISLLKPYVVALTPDDRQKLAKMSDKTVPMVEKIIEYTATHPEFSPAYLDVAELKKDMAATTALLGIARLAEPFNDNLNDTIMLAGSEAYVAALAYYNSVKQAAKMNVPNAKTVYEDLKKRFEGQGASSKTPAPAPKPAP
jgi:hypothetical protein